jgi:3-hydroxymyristoyl/3-hydroxydecanoyl-(acyl carrier protein) dehydratase
VLPATLLLDAQLQLAQQLIAETPDLAPTLQVTRITNVKVRAFSSPGSSLGLFAEFATPAEADPEPILIKVGALVGTRTIAAAKFFFAP